MNGSKNLILGFCAPRKFDHLAPFIASLRHVGFAGDVCLLIEHTAADTVDLLRAHGVVVERAAPSGLPRMSSTASRFFGFLDYLTSAIDRYGQVMLIDPMAVVFQSDPFAAPLSADLVSPPTGGGSARSKRCVTPWCRRTARAWRRTCTTARWRTPPSRSARRRACCAIWRR